jgi:MFS family permease
MRRSLAASTAEGMAGEIVQACAGAAMVTAWALYLHASPLLLGVLWALPFFGQLVHLPAAWLTTRLPRRTVAIVGQTASRYVLSPLIALPFLHVSLEAKRMVLIVVFAASSVLAVVGHNAWMAWMGDLVPARVRGRYFGKRTALCTLGGSAASLAAGALLDAAKAHRATGVMLAALAAFAWLAGTVSTRMMRRQHDRPADAAPAPALRDVMTPFTDELSQRLLAYQIGWNAALGLTASVCAIYMLQTLRVGFAGMAIYGAVIAASRVLSAPLWGKAVDRAGAKPVLLVCSLGSAIASALWLFAAPGTLWPIALDAVLSGVMLGGQGLAAFAVPLAVAPKESRTVYLSAFTMVGGVAFGLASITGGALAGAHAIAPAWAQLLFAASSLGRLASAVLAQRILEPGAQPVAGLARALVRVRAR